MSTPLSLLRWLLGLLAVVCCLGEQGQAQEFQARVEVHADALGEAGRRLSEPLQRQLTELINRTAWTGLRYSEEERIPLTLILTITGRQDEQLLTGELAVTALRPVYHADYQSTVYVQRDRDLSFRYEAGDRLEYDPQRIDHPLVALVAYYAYYALAEHLDSFASLGGTEVQPLLANLVSNSSSRTDWSGWERKASAEDRVSASERLTDNTEETYRKLWYRYHRLGLDRLSDDPEPARAVIVACLEELQTFARANYRSPSLAEFERSKLEEVASLFADSPVALRRRLYELLRSLFPASTQRIATLQS